MKLRIKFTKSGPVRFIGHLDVMRFFQKAIRRAGIDVAYTGGFSPHQIMTFAAPLGVGLESEGEYMDIEVNSIRSCGDVKDRLNEAGVPGIRVVSVKILPEKAGNAMASVAAASYLVRFRQGREPSANPGELLPDFLSREHIPYKKETKKGTRELDLRPGIYRLTWDGDAFSMLLNASSAGNIKPAQVIEALFALRGESLQENALLITRKELYADTGTPEEMRLVSLDEIGRTQKSVRSDA
ncbi:MAG: TIGR03936 family radical SAM-associated protein [bacterium]|nr:TIGR03936 family radical SAM-associated protein [bacterium]